MVKKIEPVDSHTNPFIQMADLLGGAVAHRNNPGSVDLRSKRGVAKEALAAHIEGNAKVGDFTQSTPWLLESGFGVWQFQPRIKKAP